ncbi:Ku protein [Arvimicrobium flavum]|uniref:non-homologous end joining protein Ku n=1 Tax=Arvimicrobium flavum TaxID=3393320 RepID=UPI00237B8D39|nr:Ku protein [Mesorhizobium shangrilense]
MAAPRAAWKGYVKFGSVAFGVKLIGAISEADKIHFRILNRKTREPVKSAYVDEKTGKIVSAEDQVKGYELSNGDMLEIEPDDIKALKPVSEHTLAISEFVDQDEIDQRYLEKPYYLIPADRASSESYALFRDALKKKGAAARSSVVLYQRGREVVIGPSGKGLVLTTLRNNNEVVSEKSAFDGLKETKVDPEMAEIAGLIIEKKQGKFDPSKFEDTYENALIEMIRAKQQGKAPPKPAPKPKENVVNLADVLRKSLEKEGVKAPARQKERKRA